jgi:hypothetical protein
MPQSEDLWVGGLFVLVSAVDRFNTPHTNRSSTTIVRFYMAEICYIAVGLASYLLLANFPEVASTFDKDTAGELGQYLSQPMLVALFLTVLLPKIPVLSDVDEWIRKQLQKMGSIPYEARRLSAELRRAEFQVPHQRQAEIRKKMLDDGFAPEDVRFEDQQSSEYFWTKISALILQLEEWESDRRFVGFMARFGTEFEDLKARYRRLSRKAKSCFRLARSLSLESGAIVQADEMVLQYQNDFMEQCTDLFRRTCDFISRGLLQCGPTYSARAAKLVALGFHVRQVQPPLTLNQLMLIFGFVGVFILGGFVFMPASGKASFEDLLARTVMISVLYSAAVTCAVYPKEAWHFARRDPNDVRPIVFYFVAGAMAVAIGAIVSLLFNSLIFRSFTEALQRLTGFSYPWLTIAFVTAFTTAALIDDKPTERLPRKNLRLLEATAHALALAIAGCIAHLWIGQLIQAAGPANAYAPSDLIWVILRSTLAGLVIGYCVPTWYREAPRTKVGSEVEIAEALARPA